MGGTRIAITAGMYGHYSAHALGQMTPLAAHDAAAWLWTHLRDAFPDALSVTLMPDHPHVIMPLGRHRRLAGILASFTRVHGETRLWGGIDEAVPLTTPDKLRRGIRYAALNPCRPARIGGRLVTLAADPLEWLWSTHRDVVGATIDPWVDAGELQRIVGWRRNGFAESWHRYVSSDPHVDVAGTRYPVATTHGHLEMIAAAALVATRSSPAALRRPGAARTTFVGLAYRCDWQRPAVLSRWCDVHPKTICRIARECPADWADAAALCLGDVRLHHVTLGSEIRPITGCRGENVTKSNAV